MQFHKYFSKDELQFLYLLFRHYTNFLPPRDVILHVLELRVKVISSSYMGAHTEKDGRKHGLEQWWYENGLKYREMPWKDGNLNGLEQLWWDNGQKYLETTWKDGIRDAETQWDKNGNKSAERRWRDGIRITQWFGAGLV